MCAETVHARFRREGDLKHANAVTSHVSSSPALGSALLPKRPNLCLSDNDFYGELGLCIYNEMHLVSEEGVCLCLMSPSGIGVRCQWYMV